jgi:hypothetical protein
VEHEIKGSDLLLFVFLEKTLFEVRLARIKARRGAQFVPLVMCVEKHKKYIVNQNSSILMTSVSRTVFVVFWYKIRYVPC